jgi:hypothetical protein
MSAALAAYLRHRGQWAPVSVAWACNTPLPPLAAREALGVDIDDPTSPPGCGS